LIIQNLEEFENDLRLNSSRPVYFFLGPETFLCQQAVNMLKAAVLSPESMGFDYAEFSGEDGIINEAIEACNTYPMLSRKRVVLITGTDKLPDADLDAALQALASLPKKSTMVFLAESFDHRKRFYRVLRDDFCVVEFPKLKGYALERWAAAFVRRQGYQCSPGAIKKLVELAGSDLQMVSAELDKLLLYAGKDKNIPDTAVETLISGSRQQGIFELIDALGIRDRNGALRSLANLVGMGEHPLVVVTMMARHCRQILIAKEYMARRVDAREISSVAQIPHFMLDKFLSQARDVNMDTVREMHVRLAEIDRKLKSTSADGRLLLEHLICARI
jgi:DNA polymerase-3 subunit delta